MWMRISPILAAVAAVAALAVAPVAAALPECTNTTPTTIQCQKPGNAQINTSPPTYGYVGPYPEFPWFPWGIGGVSIGIGGI
jgi:hypothetical protein